MQIKSMVVNAVQIKRFKDLYENKFNIELSDLEAGIEARKLLLIVAECQMIEKDKYQDEYHKTLRSRFFN
jgi:hypothetical protein